MPFSDEFLQECIRISREHDIAKAQRDAEASRPRVPDASAPNPWAGDPHAVPAEEALNYYAGLPSWPPLLYRTSTEPWSLRTGPGARRRLRELRPVYDHPMLDLWNDGLCARVSGIMDAHQVHLTTIDIVRFMEVLEGEDEGQNDPEARKPAIGPVTIWVGVAPASTSPTAAHDAAAAVLALLAEHQITDVDVAFRESVYRLL
ncbi:hypothetical protein C2E23DRAFT_886587 [Lenzites betulinus]|nr:hypothetical protein C2E23DRAFT_886587 [Lenzites betulinus]